MALNGRISLMSRSFFPIPDDHSSGAGAPLAMPTLLLGDDQTIGTMSATI